MRNQSALFLGLLLILFGAMLLASNLLHIDFGAICWPAGLIVVGLWMLLRPRLAPAGTNVEMRLLGDVKRTGSWSVSSEEFWSFVGDTKLDLTQADIPLGETALRAYGFVGDVRLRLPQNVGFSVFSTAFLSDTKILGQKQDTFLTPFEYTSPGYEMAERRIRLQATFFVANIRIEQG